MKKDFMGLRARKGAKAQKEKSTGCGRCPHRTARAGSAWRPARALFVILLMVMWGVGTAVAQNEVAARVTAVQSSTHIGETVELVLEVTHPRGWRVIAPPLAQTWGDFEVRSQSAMEIVTTDAAVEVSQQTIAVMLWGLGEFATPPLTVTVSSPEGELLEVTADPVTIHVESVLTQDDLALRDIKPQATLPLAVWWPWLVGALGLVGLLSVFWWRGRGGETAVPFVDNRSLQQIALDELDEIAASGLAERGDFKEHYAQTTDVLRRYLDGGFATMTAEQTTAEIRRAVQSLNFANDEKKRLTALLNEADLVKFAKVLPTIEDARRATEEAKAFVAAIGIDD
jgi:hypothetical protein